MIKIFPFVVSLFLTFTSVEAEIVKDLKIKGNKRVTNETVKIYGEIEIGKDYSESDLDKVLKNLYSTNFFEDVNLKLQNNILFVSLKEYPVINQLIVIGEKSNKYREQIKKVINLKEKRSFIKSLLAKDLEIIKNLYSSVGYNFSEVEGKIKKIDDNNLDLIFEINRGAKTKISSINFIGNKKIRSKRLRDIIASEEDKFWKVISKNTNFSQNLIELDKRLLSNYYKSLGFYDIRINSNFAQITEAGKAELIYSIDEGKRYTINKISTNIDEVFDKNLFFSLDKIYNNYIGDYYSPFKVKKMLEELDNLINKNNLQFVEHNVQEIIEGDAINIIFNVSEGEKVLVERINISGNNITNEDVIRSELILDEGDPFTKLKLNKSIAEIKERNIFKSVNSEVTEGSQKNLKIIDINVEEKATGEVSAGAGVGTAGGSFAFQVKENNWLGQGKNVGFNIDVNEESLSGTLNYTDPNYDFLGNSINYSISSTNNDVPDMGYENSIVSAGLGTSFEQYKDITASLGVTASYDDLRTDSSASSSLKKQSGNFSEISGSYGFTYDRRNRAFMPTSGSIVSFSQTLPLIADSSYISNTFLASKYHTLGESVVGAAKLYLSSINGIGEDDVRISKRKSLSSRRLRGFEKNKVGPVDGTDFIGGNYTAAVNFEANLPTLLPEDTNTDINVFLDFGNIWGVDYDSSIDDSNKIRSSTGIVANYNSPIGPMSFVFSQNISKASTDKTESFTFSLGTTF